MSYKKGSFFKFEIKIVKLKVKIFSLLGKDSCSF